jgi:dehydrogenase/reductase SDR family protein 7B
MSLYSGAKHALHGFFNSLRNEVNNQITITIACPSLVDTEAHQKHVFANGSIGPVNFDTSKLMSVEVTKNFLKFLCSCLY